MPLIIPSNSISDGGYVVDNSCRFDDGSSDYLERTAGSTGNRKTLTISYWLKRSNITTANSQGVLNAGILTDGNNHSFCGFQFSTDTAIIQTTTSNSNVMSLQSNALFRDVSAWYHFVWKVDTTQATESDRVTLYVNGVEFSLTGTFPSLNQDTWFNYADTHTVGTRFTNYLNGYLTEMILIDGTALDPTSFGEFDEDTGIWKPIDVSGLTFGTNGFYLDFENSGSLGADVSGNGNNFTVNNLTAIDQSTDTCTNNFATLNPLTKSSATFSEGNLKQGGAGASAVATFGVSSGKWYFEQKILGGNNEAHLGFALENSSIFKDNVTGSTVRGSGYVSLYSFDGKIYNEGSATSSFGTFSANDIISFALDVDAGDIFLYQNGTLLNSGSAVVSGKTGKTWFPFGNFDAGNVTGIEHNFGGTQTFTISSGNSDGNGYGNFEYSVPSGYYALNTKNLAEYG
jgi:hypothetical protein